VNKLNNEYKEINDKLNKINEEIDEDKMDEKILVNYAEEFDTNYEKTLNENLEEENHGFMYGNNFYQNHKSGSSFLETTKKRQKEMENAIKLKAYRQKREDKKLSLRDNIMAKEKIKLQLESELNTKKNLLEKSKEEMAIVRNKLINRYHIRIPN
jgi:hypothetical protein